MPERPRPTLISPPRLGEDQDENLRTLTEYLQAVYQHIQIEIILNETLDNFEDRIATNETSLVGVESHFNEDLGGITPLDETVGAYSAAQVQRISDKIDEIIAAFPVTLQS